MLPAETIARKRLPTPRTRRSGVDFLTGALLAFWMGSSPAMADAGVSAGTLQDRDAIRALVREFIASSVGSTAVKLETEVGAIDSRLALPFCARTEAFFPPGAPRTGNTTVGVRCRRGASWTLYVPARVRVWRRVVVAARALPRGAPLAPGDLRIESREVAETTQGFLEDPAEARGKLAKRPLAPGTVITVSLLASPHLVRRGDRVTLLVESGSLTVRATGEALGDGRQGDRIRVRNLSTDKIIQGTVAGPGTVRMPF